MPLNTFVKNVSKTSHSLASNGTCYLHLNCKRNNISWCLDWREVCDRRVDCWPDPVDEQHCEILEQNECGPNEYRCLNGQCIPEIFLLDKAFFSDCLDNSDEDLLEPSFYQTICTNTGNPTFRCTDTMCRHWSFSDNSFVEQTCGASYSRDKLNEEFDRKLLLPSANTHINENCWATMICLVQAQRQISFVSHQKYIYCTRKYNILFIFRMIPPMHICSMVLVTILVWSRIHLVLSK
jgi:hypothetical protein